MPLNPNPSSRTAHTSYRFPLSSCEGDAAGFANIQRRPEQKICSSLNPQIEFLLILSLIDLHMVSDPPKRREDREV
jgi:hypothetical protein